LGKKSSTLMITGPERAALTLVLAHGAGAGMDSPFMNIIAQGVAPIGVRVVRFEFPYMRARRELGKKGAPDREPVLLRAWRDVVNELGGGDNLAIGGKSLGGRIASMVADQADVRGLVCLGYPFHPPGRPDRLRTEHLKTMRTPTLIIQGTRDPFGAREEAANYNLSANIRFEWIADGDHSLKPRARSGRTEAQNLSEAISLINGFLTKLVRD
jgi:predicted alpha/beta-hydrolase family hydrolase